MQFEVSTYDLNSIFFVCASKCNKIAMLAFSFTHFSLMYYFYTGADQGFLIRGGRGVTKKEKI